MWLLEAAPQRLLNSQNKHRTYRNEYERGQKETEVKKVD